MSGSSHSHSCCRNSSHIGQVGSIDYDDGAHPLRITGITDPSDRESMLTHNPAGQPEPSSSPRRFIEATHWAGPSAATDVLR
jgi:hypothetical protein